MTRGSASEALRGRLGLQGDRARSEPPVPRDAQARRGPKGFKDFRERKDCRGFKGPWALLER